MKNHCLASALLLFSLCTQAIESDTDLVKQLDEIRLKSGVKGIAVGIVRGGSPTTFVSSGFADIKKRTPILASTQFRFGSVSKMFVALSIMKLVENNALTLDAELKTLAPEIAFDNPYAPDYPLRVIHLLNHTTGWDAMRFAEKAPQLAPPISIKQALDLLPQSRTSRWPPGARSAYNNTGPLVAAYLVEKFSGLTFEHFVKQHFLEPLDMQHTDYFYTDDYRRHAATPYLGSVPVPYTHLNNRAAGGLNSSIEDMVKFIQFLNQQGHTENNPILSSASFSNIQRPTGCLACSAGLEITRLAGLQQFSTNGITFLGHEGSVRGSSALLVYQPNLKLGYVVAVNGEGRAIPPIQALLSNMLSSSNTTHNQTKNLPLQASHIDLVGWYKNISPISQLIAPFQRLLPWKLNITDGQASIRPLLGGQARLLGAGTNGQFLQEQTNKVVAVPLLDPIAGHVFHYGPNTLKRISSLSAWLPIVVGVCWFLSGVLAILLALWWLPNKWLKNVRLGYEEQQRLWPLITFSFAPLCLFLLLLAKNSIQLNRLLGQPSWLSIGLMIGTSLFFLSSLWSLFNWWRITQFVSKRAHYWHSTLLTSLNALVSVYLLSHGVIGIRLWT